MIKCSCIKNNGVCMAHSSNQEAYVKKTQRWGDLLNRVSIPDNYIKVVNISTGHSNKNK